MAERRWRDEARQAWRRCPPAERNLVVVVLVVVVLASCGADAPAGTRAVDTTRPGTTLDDTDLIGELDTEVTGTNVDRTTVSPDSGSVSSLPWRKVTPEVVTMLETEGSVPVLISLDVNDDPERIATVQEQVLDRVGETGLRVRVAFDRVPAIAGVVSTPNALVALERDPGVVDVAVDAGGAGDGGGG